MINNKRALPLYQIVFFHAVFSITYGITTLNGHVTCNSECRFLDWEGWICSNCIAPISHDQAAFRYRAICCRFTDVESCLSSCGQTVGSVFETGTCDVYCGTSQEPQRLATSILPNTQWNSQTIVSSSTSNPVAMPHKTDSDKRNLTTPTKTLFKDRLITMSPPVFDTTWSVTDVDNEIVPSTPSSNASKLVQPTPKWTKSFRHASRSMLYKQFLSTDYIIASELFLKHARLDNVINSTAESFPHRPSTKSEKEDIAMVAAPASVCPLMLFLLLAVVWKIYKRRRISQSTQIEIVQICSNECKKKHCYWFLGLEVHHFRLGGS